MISEHRMFSLHDKTVVWGLGRKLPSLPWPSPLGYNLLLKLGYTNVTYMAPGFIGWTEEHLPIVIPDPRNPASS